MQDDAVRVAWAAILLLLASATANAAFYYAREGQIARLSAEISYRVDDPANPASFEDISKATSGWISQKEKPFAGTKEPAALWFRLDLPQDIRPGQVLLNVPLWDHEEFFVVRDGVLVDRQKAGALLRFDERVLRTSMVSAAAAGFVPVDLVAGKRTTVYGHVTTQNQYVVADGLVARPWDPQRVFDAERRDRIIQGAFFGVMFFLIAYNLALFFIVREPRFLYYVLMETGFCLAFGAVNGLVWEFLTPNHPEWEFHYVWLGGTLGGFGGWQFLRHYLDTPRYLPRIDAVLRIIVYAHLLSAPFVFLPLGAEFLQRWMFVGMPIGAAVLIVVSALAVKRRIPAAWSLLASMGCVVAGLIIFAAAGSGFLPLSTFTMTAGQTGSVLAGIILSVGLGYRLQDERTRLARLKRFLSPKVSELIAAGQLDDPLATRRREVTIVFVDLRGFTAFSETAAPEDVLGVLREYHAEIGRLVGKHEGTIEHFAGDGVMIIFNDPAPLPDPAWSAVSFAVELRDDVARLSESWRRLGHQLACGLGIAQGYATIGTIGFPGRQDYGVIGAVNNLAARLCAQAAPGQVLVSQRVLARVEDKVVSEFVGDLVLKGIHAPVPAFNIVALRPYFLGGALAGADAGAGGGGGASAFHVSRT